MTRGKGLSGAQNFYSGPVAGIGSGSAKEPL